MAEKFEPERIKTCLKCNHIMPFHLTICPKCKTPQAPSDAESCPNCAAALRPREIICPECNRLTVATAAIPVPPKKAVEAGADDTRRYNLISWILLAFAMILEAGLIIDYLAW